MNLKFIESYRGIQAHTSLVLESLDKLKRLLLSTESKISIQMAYKHVHETLHHIIPSIYAKDVNMYKESEPPEDDTTFLSQPSLLHQNVNLANKNEIEILIDVINKFAL